MVKSIQDHPFHWQLFHLHMSLPPFYFRIHIQCFLSKVWSAKLFFFLLRCLSPICWPALLHVVFLHHKMHWTQEPVHQLLHKQLCSLPALFCFGIITLLLLWHLCKVNHYDNTGIKQNYSPAYCLLMHSLIIHSMGTFYITAMLH